MKGYIGVILGVELGFVLGCIILGLHWVILFSKP